jgi:hypothetical protein
MDWTVYEGSTISRLPKAVRPAALLLRNAKAAIPRRPHHRMDGITTVHITGFLETPDFARCYGRAVRAAGWDYGIPFRVHQALWCSHLAQRVPGAFVELGTGRGFVMSALLEDGLKRPVHLFDTFLPNRVSHSGSQSRADTSPFYAESFEAVRANFAEWPNVQLHRGNVLETLPVAPIDSVAFLHVDMNHPDPEEFGVRFLWPKLSAGAVLLFDDYAFSACEAQFERCNRLADELGFEILGTPTGQGIAIKP